MKPKMKPERDRSNPLAFLFRKTWINSAGTRKTMVFFTVMFIAAETFSVLANPMIWAKIMSVIQKEGITDSNVWQLIKLMAYTLVATVVFWALHGPARVLECNNAFNIRTNYRRYLLQGVMAMPMKWHSDTQSGDTIDKIEKGTTALYQFSENTFELIYSMVKFGLSFAILAYLFPPSAIIVLVMLVVTLWIVIRFDRVLIDQYKQLSWAENRISANVFDAISNISTVVILRVEKFVFNAIMRKVMEPFGLTKTNNWVNELKWFLSSTCCSATVFLVMSAYFYQHRGASGDILIGQIYMLYRYLENITDLFNRFTNLYSDTVRRKAKVNNAEELAKNFRGETLSNHVLPPEWKSLKIEGLTFSYEEEEGERRHLDDVSLNLTRGQTVAFIGSTGSGKTTCLHVMRDLYQPAKLKLSVDGQHIPHGFDGISRAITLVPQHPEILAKTIRENLTLEADHYTEEEIQRCIDLAGFREVLGNLPRGLESMVNEKGVKLSGGERQRLALARGLLACLGKDILLLDEPTSSLDPATELRVYKNILDGFRGRTIVSTVHRLHLLPLFDRVCLFDKGRIIASGTFDELLANCPEFQALWESTSKRPGREVE